MTAYVGDSNNGPLKSPKGEGNVCDGISQSSFPVQSFLPKCFVVKPGQKHRTHTVELIERTYEERQLPRHQRRISKILHNRWFDYFMGVVIMFNMVAMIIETDRTVSEEDSNEAHWTHYCGWIVLVVFLLELSARLYAFQQAFWQDSWNVFDFAIVAIDVTFSLLGLIFGDLFPVSVLRILRLAKLARVSKVLRVFPELRLLIAGLVSSMSAILWGTFLLLICLLVWSMVAVLFIHPLNKQVDYGDSCPRCPDAYSSVMQASLTFWQQIVTGDSWGQATIPLIQKEPITAVFFVPVFLSVGMAVINLILGVVVSVAQQAKEDIEDEDRKEEAFLKAEKHNHLLWLCMKMDKDKDGVISLDEFCKAYDEPGEFSKAMESLGISKEEIRTVWKVISMEKSGQVEYEDVVSALYDVKTQDVKFTLAYIKNYIMMMKEALENTMTQTSKMEHIIEETRHDIEETRHDIEEVEALEFGVWQELSTCNRRQRRQNDDQTGVAETSLKALSIGLNQQHIKSKCEEKVKYDTIAVDTGGESEVMSGDVSDWLQQVCQRIALMRVELGDILVDMSSKCGPSASALLEEITLTGSTSAGAKVASRTRSGVKVSL